MEVCFGGQAGACGPEHSLSEPMRCLLSLYDPGDTGYQTEWLFHLSAQE